MILGMSLGIIMLASLRLWLWPVTWFDQILYLKQGWVFAQTRAVYHFLNTTSFSENGFLHVMLWGVRPGMPVLYSLFMMGEKTLEQSEFWVNSILVYYFWILVGLIYYLGKVKGGIKAGLRAVFFSLTSFYLVRFTVFGFKEVVIMGGILIGLKMMDDFAFNKSGELLTLATILGLISFINPSGILISVFLIGLLIIEKRLDLAKMGLLISVFVAWAKEEILALSGWIMTYLRNNIYVETNRLGITNEKLVTEEYEQIIGEKSAYQIVSTSDSWFKGKLQGLTQIQFFGFVFILFLIIVGMRYRKMWRDKWERLLLLFTGIYGFVFFDPLGINPHRYSYVLSVSPKYTIMLVPIVSLLIAYNYKAIEDRIVKIGIRGWSMLMAALVIFYIWFKFNEGVFIKLVGMVVPLSRNSDYYLGLMNKVLSSAAVFAGLWLIVVVCTFVLRKRKIAEKKFREIKISVLMIYIGLFFIPCMLWFETNFGVINTIEYGLSDRWTKLTNLKVGADFYKAIDFLNHKDPRGKLLLINENSYPVSYFWVGADENIKNIEEFKLGGEDLLGELKKEGYKYVLANGDSGIITAHLDKRFESGNEVVYEIR